MSHPLACPVCGAPLADEGRALRCPNRHAFDVARQGYVNLLLGGAHTGTADTREMVAARARFLARGHFRPLTAAIAAKAEIALTGSERGARTAAGAPRRVSAVKAEAAVPGCVLDIGAGTGAHLAAVLDALPGRDGIALDLSKHAARRAARAHARIRAVVADAWRAIPLPDGAAALVLDVFAPRNAAELRRVLRPGGTLLVVTPTPTHLAELVDALGLLHVDAAKDARLADQLEPAGFRLASDDRLAAPLVLSHDDVADLVAMGPSARHGDPADRERRIRALPEPVRATLAVRLTTWR